MIGDKHSPHVNSHNGTLEHDSWESVLFHPVLKAYPTHHSWIITAHVYLGNLDKQWKMFIQRKARSQQLLISPQWKPLAPSYLLSALQVELAKPGQHLHLVQTFHTHSDATTKERTFFQWHVTSKQMHQEKPLTFLRGHPQLAHQNSHD